jgi:hypothetical protein
MTRALSTTLVPTMPGWSVIPQCQITVPITKRTSVGNALTCDGALIDRHYNYLTRPSVLKVGFKGCGGYSPTGSPHVLEVSVRQQKTNRTYNARRVDVRSAEPRVEKLASIHGDAKIGEKGVFIAVLPNKQGVEVFLESAATVPLGSQHGNEPKPPYLLFDRQHRVLAASLRDSAHNDSRAAVRQ